MKRVMKIMWKAMKWSFVVFLIFLGSLFFRAQRISGAWLEGLLDRLAPTNLVVRVDSLSVGFRHGLAVRGLRVYDLGRTNRFEATARADEIVVHPVERRVVVIGASYPRLPDSYYAPENRERNAPVEGRFPEIGDFRLVLEHPNILSVTPEHVEARVEVGRRKILIDRIRLTWPTQAPATHVDGLCSIDLDDQKIYGEAEGPALQAQVRPLLVALDLPVALPYMDGFTDVPGVVPARAVWNVNLVNNDFDLGVQMNPNLGKYNDVAMQKATGKIQLHSYTRGDCLNYHTQVGPVVATGEDGRRLEGIVDIVGTNRYNVVSITAKSNLPVAEILKIGGFSGRYVEDDVIGNTEGSVTFRFPRAMTNNYEVLNGEGHLRVRDGHLSRVRLFAGLTKLLAEHVPGVASVVDQSEASIDYRIENGIVKTDNIFIEGEVFSIKMYGQFDAVKDALDFVVRVQFTKKDSIVGKYLIQPVTWPFAKLLLEFKLTGTAAAPQWSYISVLDRVLEALK